MVDLSAVLAKVPTRHTVASALDRMPATRDAISPFVPGETVGAAVDAAGEILLSGMSVSVLHLPDPAARASSLLVHMQTIEAFDEANIADGADLMVDLGDLGLARGVEAAAVASDLAALCGAAEHVGMTVTLAGLAHEHLDVGLSIHAALAGDHPDLGMTISADLLRSEADCGDLARAGARVRLVRREAAAPKALAFSSGHEVDRSFVRCLRLLMAEGARAVVATHDPRLIEIATALAVGSDVEPSGYCVQLRLGVRPEAAAELVATGSRVAILVPFGADWPTYISQRIALRPGVVVRAARAVVGRWSA